MPIPTNIDDLSTTPAANFPAGTDSPSIIDDVFREHAAYIAQLRDRSPDAANVGYSPAGTGAVATTVQAKLRETVSVRDFGAVGDGVTDDTEAIQAAIDSLSTSGGEVNFDPATYRAKSLSLPAAGRISLRGKYGATVLKVPDGFDATCLTGNSVSGSFDHISLDGIIFDGNKSASPLLVARSAVSFAGLKYFTAKNCTFRNATGYGLGIQAYGGTSFTGPQSIIYMENCRFDDNGDGVGADAYDGLDIKSGDKITMVHCVADGNVEKGINIRGREVVLVACHALNTAYGGIELNANAYLGDPARFTLLGCSATGNSERGLTITNTYTDPAAALMYVQVVGGEYSSNGTQGITINSTSDKLGHVSIVSARCVENASNGIRATAPSLRNLELVGVICEDNLQDGVYLAGADARVIGGRYRGNTGRGIVEDAAAGTRTYVSGADVSGNTVGGILDRGAMIIRDVKGWATEARLQATGMSLAATGTVSAVIAHGLPFTPATSQCVASLAFASTNAFALAWGPRVVTVDATNITVAFNVSTAAAGGTAAVNVQILPRATA